MPRKKAVEETPVAAPVAAVDSDPVEVPAPAVAAVEQGDVAPDAAPFEPWQEPDEQAVPVPVPEPEPVQELEPEPAPEPVGFTTVHDPYAPAQDVVIRYPLPPVVTVTASWLSEAEAKVLRAQHQPVVDAANTVPETKDADTKE